MNKKELFKKLHEPDVMEKLVKRYVSECLIMEDVQDNMREYIEEELGYDEYLDFEDCDKILDIIVKWGKNKL
jgi:hypothetical protein